MELQQLRTTGDTVLIRIPERQETTLKHEGRTLTIDGRPLWFDPSWRAMETKHLGGVLVAVPERVGESYLLTRKGFAKGYVRVSAIQERLGVGDYVYCDWTVSEDHGKVKLADFEVPGVGGVYRATLNQVVARVREEGGVRRLEPYGSYVLCKQVWPDDVGEVEVPGFPGKLRLRLSASGLTMGTEEVPPIPFQGQVTHVGLPLRGQPQRVRVGQRVVFDKAMCGKDAHPMKLKLGEEEFLCIRQDYIAAVLEEETQPELIARMERRSRAQEPLLRAAMQQPDELRAAAMAELGFQKEGMMGEITLWGPAGPATEKGTALGFGHAAVSDATYHDGPAPEVGLIWGQMRPSDRKYPVEGGRMEVNGQALPALVTDCCHAEHYNVGHGAQAHDRCRACGQVAHLVPAAEFSRNKPAA